MIAPRFLTDEDVYADRAVVLRQRGYDAVSTPEAGRLTEDDPSQLDWAARQGRVLMSFNVGDFVRLHGEWLRSGKHHAGLIVSEQQPLGEILRRLLNLAAALSAEEMCDRLEFLTNWPARRRPPAPSAARQVRLPKPQKERPSRQWRRRRPVLASLC